MFVCRRISVPCRNFAYDESVLSVFREIMGFVSGVVRKSIGGFSRSSFITVHKQRVKIFMCKVTGTM